MFGDVLIVVIVYAAALFVAVLSYCGLRRRPSVAALPLLLQKLSNLMKYGQDGAHFAIARPSEDRNRPPPSLTLTKYVTPGGDFGLECFVSTSGEGLKLIPGRGTYGSDDWPTLAQFLTDHGIPMVTVRSPPDENWQDSYFMLRLDFGRDGQLPLRFAGFFFGTLLKLPMRGFRWRLEGVYLADRLLLRKVTSLSQQQLNAQQKRDKSRSPWARLPVVPRAEVEDVYAPMAQMLGVAGILYGLAVSGNGWPVLSLTLAQKMFEIRIFDLLFILIFALGIYGGRMQRDSGRAIPVLLFKVATALPMTFAYNITRFAVKVSYLSSLGKMKELFAPETPKLYGALTWTLLPSQPVARSIGVGVIAIGILACVVTISRWLT